MYTSSLPRTFFPGGANGITGSGWLQEPRVVHSSHGRIRVHLPHWPGTGGEQIVAGLGRLPGVTNSEANPLTGNVLIRYDPQQTQSAALLAALPALRLEQPVTPPALFEEVGGPSLDGDQPATVVYMTGTGRVVYRVLGWSSVGMAVVGAITPGIPTAPFVIIAGYFFVRSSPEAHQWLRQSRWFGPILRDWEAHRGVRRSVRNAGLTLIGAGMAVTTMLPISTLLKATILAMQVVGVAIIMRLRVVDPVAPDVQMAGH